MDVEPLLVPKCLRLPLSAHTPEKLVSSDENFAEGMFEVGASALANNHHQVNLFACHWTAAPENRSVIKKRAAAVYFLQ